MKKRKTIFLIGLILFFAGCVSNNEILTYEDLSEEISSGSIQIVGCDTAIYNVDKFIYSDSSITIIGLKKKNNTESKFNGELLFKDISYIQTNRTSLFPTLAFVGLNIYIVGNGLGFLSQTSGIEPIIKITHPGRGETGSCPYIYSWNGKEYQLEGEAFGTALGKALETETCLVLRNLKPENNKLKLKFSNERPETHFFNNIKFTAVELNKNETVYSDNHNSLYVLNEKKRILKAFDCNNQEITKLLLDEDNIYWQSDLSSAKPKFNFEDQIIVELKNISNTDSLSLMISAINTEISNVVFAYLQQILGNEFINFTKAAEIDQEIIEVLKETLLRSSLKIDVWNGYAWQYFDFICPEANHVKFQKLVRLPIFKDENNNMKIRLRCLSDVWEIDALNYNDSPSKKLIKHKPKLVRFYSDTQNNYFFLEQKDEHYIKLLPGQSINLEFESVKVSNSKKISYAITVGGFLYEWIIDKNLVFESSSNKMDINTPKIKLVKNVLKNMNSVLPVIYDNWKDVKYKYALNNK